jgi:1-acyl-sn-glycerol-3-phosphate acyltransferase
VKWLRVIGRLFQLAWVVLVGLADYPFHCAFLKNNPRQRRAVWLQRHSRRALKMFRLQPQVAGPVPSRGLLISNHLGYLDILVLSAITPAVFVSKREVKFWPVFGQFAQLAGTLFVDRTRRTRVGGMNREIQDALDAGALVVLFPEGTSSNGEGVLPFKTALLEPAARSAQPLSVACIQYALDDGDAAWEICYWGDHTFFPHLLNLFTKRRLRAAVRFAEFPRANEDRKVLAKELREEILNLKT